MSRWPTKCVCSACTDDQWNPKWSACTVHRWPWEPQITRQVHVQCTDDRRSNPSWCISCFSLCSCTGLVFPLSHKFLRMHQSLVLHSSQVSRWLKRNFAWRPGPTFTCNVRRAWPKVVQVFNCASSLPPIAPQFSQTMLVKEAVIGLLPRLKKNTEMWGFVQT